MATMRSGSSGGTAVPVWTRGTVSPSGRATNSRSGRSHQPGSTGYGEPHRRRPVYEIGIADCGRCSSRRGPPEPVVGQGGRSLDEGGVGQTPTA